MNHKWRPMCWGDIVILEYGKALRGYRESSGRYPVYGTNGQIGWHTEPLCSHPGVIVGRKGAYRGVHYSDLPFYVIDTAFYLEPISDELDLEYAYYNLLTRDINKMDSGSAIPSTSRTDFYSMPLLLPPLEEQKAIANVLRTLDEKIKLNRRINKTLEAIARSIFRSWFVDFDPVWAKIEGRDCPLYAETMALFPDHFEDSELGEIPAGWEIATLGDVTELVYGKALKADNRIPGRTVVYGSNGQVGWHNEPLVRGPGIVVGRKGNPGTVTWASDDFFPIDTTFYVKPRGVIKSLLFILHALGHQNLPSLSADSAVPGLNRNIAYMNLILVPDNRITDSFDQLVKPLYEKLSQNSLESDILTELRDTLLPRLISGELRVPDPALD